jgi:hypothetical protein
MRSTARIQLDLRYIHRLGALLSNRQVSLTGHVVHKEQV